MAGRPHDADPAFKESVANALRRFMDGDNPHRRRYTGEALADLLRIDGASLSRYLNQGQVMGGDLLARALLLGLVLIYRDMEIMASTPGQSIQFQFGDGAILDPVTTEGIAVNVPRRPPQRERGTIRISVVG